MPQKIKIGKTSKEKISFLRCIASNFDHVSFLSYSDTLQWAKLEENLFFEVFHILNF